MVLGKDQNHDQRHRIQVRCWTEISWSVSQSQGWTSMWLVFEPHDTSFFRSREMYGEWDYDAISSVVSPDQVFRHTDFPWSIKGLSRNPRITIGFITKYGLDLPWEWDSIGSAIDPAEILLYPNFPWNRRSLSRNPRLTVALIQLLNEKPECFERAGDDWDWGAFSRNATEADVIDHPNLPWVIGPLGGSYDDYVHGRPFPSLSTNPRLTVAMIVAVGETRPEWEWYSISRRIDSREVLEMPSLPWNINGLRWNPTMTPGFFFELEEDLGVPEDETVQDEEVRTLVVGYSRPEWSRVYLSQNLTLTLDYMLWYDGNIDDTEDPSNLSWDISTITRNLSPADLYAGRFTYEWDPYEIVRRKDFIELLRIDPDWMMKYVKTLSFPGIPLRDVYLRPHLPWDRHALSRNPEIGPNDILRLDALEERGRTKLPGIPVGNRKFFDARLWV